MGKYSVDSFIKGLRYKSSRGSDYTNYIERNALLGERKGTL
jgi:hypothetical protein